MEAVQIPISIHAPRVGCDGDTYYTNGYFILFQSTHPVWGATMDTRYRPKSLSISIHAPRVGCDVMREGGVVIAKVFQSTHPVWGATLHTCTKVFPVPISIHAPRVGCDYTPLWLSVGERISIHAPRVGCDLTDGPPPPLLRGFQSTHPVWGATRSPCPGEERTGFQSTHPVWGATQSAARTTDRIRISIHAPRVGCDSNPLKKPGNYKNFNPRTPCGVRPDQR